MSKHIEDNPYQSPESTTEQSETVQAKPLGRLATLLAAIMIGCGITVIVGETLSFLVLLPPMNRWFSMRGEFDSLILIGMPMWSGGFSLITAIVFGATYPRRYSVAVSMVLAVALVTWFGWSMFQSNSRPSERYTALTVSTILFLSLILGLLAAWKGIARINRIRTTSVEDWKSNQRAHTRRQVTLIGLSGSSCFLDAIVVAMIFEDTLNFWLAPLSIVGFMFGLGVIAWCVYQTLARIELRPLAALCSFVSLAALALTLYLWLKIVWFGSG